MNFREYKYRLYLNIMFFFCSTVRFRRSSREDKPPTTVSPGERKGEFGFKIDAANLPPATARDALSRAARARRSSTVEAAAGGRAGGRNRETSRCPPARRSRMRPAIRALHPFIPSTYALSRLDTGPWRQLYATMVTTTPTHTTIALSSRENSSPGAASFLFCCLFLILITITHSRWVLFVRFPGSCVSVFLQIFFNRIPWNTHKLRFRILAYIGRATPISNVRFIIL